jgi:hypothetical protein
MSRAYIAAIGVTGCAVLFSVLPGWFYFSAVLATVLGALAVTTVPTTLVDEGVKVEDDEVRR